MTDETTDAPAETTTTEPTTAPVATTTPTETPEPEQPTAQPTLLHVLEDDIHAIWKKLDTFDRYLANSVKADIHALLTKAASYF